MNEKLKSLPTSLELVKDLKSFAFRFDQKSNVDCLYVSGALDIIEKELKALEIIKEERVNVDRLIIYFAFDGYRHPGGLIRYNNSISMTQKELTQEEYDLLKETLL